MSFFISRFFWLFIAIICFICVFVAHFVFQVWLFMPPCENCVYIRYFMLCAGFGAILAFLAPRLFGVLGYLGVLYGSICGLVVSLRLHKIHASLNSGELFGLSACKMTPEFDFGLKLDLWLPSIFKPLALCGNDAPVVPLDAKLNAIQAWFVELYSQGWYLLPKYEFLNMAQCCMIVFAGFLVLLIIRIFGILKWKKL